MRAACRAGKAHDPKPHLARKRRPSLYSPAAVPSGIFKSSTKPTMNNTATERTPTELEPVTWVNTLTSNVPMMVAYLPKISKKP